jgi:lambda family phage tail tape measure protein
MEQQLKLNIINQVIGAQSIDEFKNKINALPADLNKVNQGTQNLKTQLIEAFKGGTIEGFITLLGAIPTPLKVIAGAAAIAKEALDFALVGEKANAVETRFERMAQNSGLVAESMKIGLKAATKGMLDDVDTLTVANKAISALGGTASRLPEILTLSRNISKSLGKDFKETYEDISMFLEVGNKKVLRQYGLVFELKDAYEKAAKAAGLQADQLTEAQQQQVRLNVLLTQAAPKYGAIADNISPIKGLVTQIEVSSKNTLDHILGWYANVDTNALESLGVIKTGDSRQQKQYEEALDQVNELSAALKRLNEDRFGAKGVSEVAAYAQEIDEVGRKLRSAKEEAERLLIERSGRSDAELYRQLAESEKANPGVKLEQTAEQKAAIAEAAKKKLIEASKKYAEQIKREETSIRKFVDQEESQIAIERLKLELTGQSSAEIEKETFAVSLRNKAIKESEGYSEKSKQKIKEETEQIIKHRQALIDDLEQQKKTFGSGAKTAMREYIEDAKDIASQTKNMFKSAFQNIEDSMVNFVKSGELNFKKFADNVIDDLIRIQVKQAEAGLISGIGSLFSGGFSGGTVTAGETAVPSTTLSANGNVMTSMGPMKLNKYANGGIARSPQLSIFGEGRQPEAYVPLPDGRTIPVTMRGQGGSGGGDVFNISVNIASDGSTNSSGDSKAKDIANHIAVTVKNVLSAEKRNGGLLAR